MMPIASMSKSLAILALLVGFHEVAAPSVARANPATPAGCTANSHVPVGSPCDNGSVSAEATSPPKSLYVNEAGFEVVLYPGVNPPSVIEPWAVVAPPQSAPAPATVVTDPSVPLHVNEAGFEVAP